MKSQPPVPTAEQAAIVAAAGHLKIEAVAGSGKTTTLLAYAAAQPARARGLYLAFNSTVRREAQAKFMARGLALDVHTAHSLAFHHIMRGSRRYRLRRGAGYKAHDVVELLGLPPQPDHGEYVLASYVLRLLAYFCNSAATQVQQLDYRQQVSSPEARAYVHQHYAAIERGCRQLLAWMEQGKIDVSHDFYLKKFQLSQPHLRYDYILFDEAQDASGSMLDVVLRQQAHATIVMVGDAHQQIYSWRYAINSLAQVAFPSLPLTTSFRFGDPIARLATATLATKAQLGTYSPVALTGLGTSQARQSRAVIARTNLGLLLLAIAYLTGPSPVQRLYFEGNLNSYIYAEEGASLFDVLHLYNDRPALVRDPLLKRLATLENLQAYAKATEDAELLMLLGVVQEYGNELPALLQELKRRQVSNDERDQAQVFFSTVHRCKGLEYDLVQLAGDFVTREEIAETAQQWQSTPPDERERIRFEEEINLLYVALTRARCQLFLPVECCPTGYPADPAAGVTLYVGRAGTPLAPPALWTAATDTALEIGFCRELPIEQLAAELGCSPPQVHARADELELFLKYPHLGFVTGSG